MKKVLVLLFAVALSSISYSAPWDICKSSKRFVEAKTLPNILTNDAYVWSAQYTPSGSKELVVVVVLDANTGSSWSRATYSIYGYYKHTQLGWPQVYYQWGYKEFTVDIPPNSYEGSKNYTLHSAETFNMSGVSTANGQGEWIESSYMTLVSFVEI